ncbi:hypothetical protein BS78_K051400 [Paspalum vaginatum]|nr:hypothetical protein BS78_K051400 [Paspalum vaginatum]
MKAIKRRLDFLAKDSVIFSLMQYPFPVVEKFDDEVFDRAAIVGRDDDKERIKDMLLQSDAEKLSIIPIVGLVGVGKTTLARLIFLDQGEGWNFDLRIWICLNRKLDLKMVASDIILQCNHAEEELLGVHIDTEIRENLQLLNNCLQNALHEKSCLIVLDDLSSTDKNQLNELKEMLKGTSECIKVVVTTSSEKTAELMHTIPPYKLHPLSEDDCWKIFSQKAFGNCDGNNTHLKEIGRGIVKRCEGMPLLIHSLGSVVQNQVTDVWLAARDEEIWKLERKFATKVELFSPLYGIYNDFPSIIKFCFLYLSIFPKGSAIDKEKLIQQWIALDVIGSKHDSLPPYVHGEMCIQDLLSTNFLQVPDMHSVYGVDNRIVPRALYIHNFIHEFVRYVACDDIIILDGSEIPKGNSKRQNFQYALLTCYRGQSSLSHSWLTRTRALHFRNSEAITFHCEAFALLKHLRVLNLSGCCTGELPASIGHLKHLKYLDVSGGRIQTLPSPMSNLTNLEVLDLSKTFLMELPSFIGNYLNLKYLNMQGCEKLQNLPSSLGHLQSLEHLRLSCCNGITELPDSMCNLRGLRILDLSRCTELQHLPPLFGNLTNLEDLSLSSCFNLKQLPESFGDLYFLRFLNLSNCYELRELPESLNNLEKLEILILRRCCRLQNLPSSFAMIKYLRIFDLAGCEALHVSTEMLTTNLEYLNLQRCINMQTQPYQFENFNKLKFLSLSQCLPTIDCLKSLSYLFNLEYLDLSKNFLDIPMSFARLQKLHTLDLTGCAPMHRSSYGHQHWPDILAKIPGLKSVLTTDAGLVASLPEYIQCSVGYEHHSLMTTDELVVTGITGCSRGLGIAKRLNLQNRLELCFLRLEWVPSYHSAADELVEYRDEEVLEKFQPNQTVEHFELVKYMGCAFPTWMMSKLTTSLPYLVNLCLFHLHNCSSLPPLGHLRNLRYLHIKDMPVLINLEMGLSGGPESLGKLTHLKLEALNLKELSILLSANNENPCFMFPTLEELSILSCPKLVFRPSLPKCVKYVIKESNMVLTCGQPLGPSSSPSLAKIEISGCMIPPDWLQWLKSMQTFEQVVIDGEVLNSFQLLDIQGTRESSGSKIQNENDGASKHTGIDSSTIVKPFPRFSITSEHSVITPSKEIPSTLHRLDMSKMSAQIPGDGSLNLSLKQVQKATRNFSPAYKIGEGEIWAVYRAVLPDNHIIVIRRAKKGHVEEAKLLMNVELLTEINHWSLVRFLGFIDRRNECIRITEYVPNGTLRQHLHDHHKRTLDFNQRIVIALDVAIALTYLHLSSGEAVICYNLKTSNILLTENYRAKICCSKLSGGGHVIIPFRGAVGYIDPEYLRTSELTTKSDVYSFGIILLEILSSHGPQDWNVLMNHQQSSVVQWALEKFYDDLMNEILDYRMEDRVDGKVLRDCLSLALSCVASCGNDRPSIQVVGEGLWKIWKDHRRNIGEQHDYEGCWEEFVEQEGILRYQKSEIKRNWGPSATDEWSGYIKHIELVEEGYSVIEGEHDPRS